MKTLKHIVNSTAGILVMMVCMLGFTSAKASENGSIKLEVYDEDNTAAVEARVTLLNGDQVITKSKPDFNAIVNFTELTPGTYDIKIEMDGHVPHLQKGIQVAANKSSYVKVFLKLDAKNLGVIDIVADKQSQVQQTMTTGMTIDLVSLNHMAVDKGNVTDILINMSSELQPTPDGKGIYSRGARQGTTEYLIDGEKVIGSFNVPSLSIQGMTVYTGGVPASYGDFTGGLVMITTKGYFNGMTTKRNMYEEITANKMDEQKWQDEQKKKNETEKK